MRAAVWGAARVSWLSFVQALRCWTVSLLEDQQPHHRRTKCAHGSKIPAYWNKKLRAAFAVRSAIWGNKKMKPKQIAKIIIDVLMTAVLLLLLAYSLVGEATHEWLGIGMFALFILHHALNNRWSRNLLQGQYTPFRVFQTVLVVLVLLCMLGSMVSGIVLSRHALAFLPDHGGQWWARTLHMLSAYWGFLFMSLHLGLHWGMVTGMAKRLFKKSTILRKWIARTAALCIAAYGIYAFMQREIGNYLFLQNQFVFFDPAEPLCRFLLDSVAMMGLFVCIGHYLSEFLKRIK